jgi:hypothetical protein
MDFSHLTPEQVAQLRALLLPESSPTLTTTSTSTDVTAAPSPFSTSLPPPAQAPVVAVPHRQSQAVRFLDPGSAQTAASANTATIPPPISQLYQRPQTPALSQHSAPGYPSHPPPGPGHPTGPTQNTSSFQPFLGINNLGVGFAAGHANQARLASAAATLPRQPALNRRTSRSTRTRGPAIQPPSIPVELAPGSALHLRSCFVSGTPDPVVRLTVKVYPPAVSFLFYCLSVSTLVQQLTQHY